jgi:hypothetical protein
VRKWDAWHRYVTLCLLAHAFLVITPASPLVRRKQILKGGSRCPGLIPLTVPQLRRLMFAMAGGPKEERGTLGSGGRCGGERIRQLPPAAKRQAEPREAAPQARRIV